MPGKNQKMANVSWVPNLTTDDRINVLESLHIDMMIYHYVEKHQGNKVAIRNDIATRISQNTAYITSYTSTSDMNLHACANVLGIKNQFLQRMYNSFK